MRAHLLITDQAYVLSRVQDGRFTELARLEGGAQRLLPVHQPLGERLLEAAIEVAEDWLMPYANHLHGKVLQVTDASGNLQAGLADVLSSNARLWSVEELEQTFLRLADAVTGRAAAGSPLAHPSFLAHVLLLRELAHHGRVSGLQPKSGSWTCSRALSWGALARREEAAGYTPATTSNAARAPRGNVIGHVADSPHG